MKPDFFGQRFCTKRSKGDVGLWVFLVVYILFGGKIPNVSPERLWFLFKGQTWGANKRIRSEPCFFRIFELKSSCNADMFQSFFWFRVFCGSFAVVYNLYVICNIPWRSSPEPSKPCQVHYSVALRCVGRTARLSRPQLQKPFLRCADQNLVLQMTLLDLFVSKKHRS